MLIISRSLLKTKLKHDITRFRDQVRSNWFRSRQLVQICIKENFVLFFIMFMQWLLNFSAVRKFVEFYVVSELTHSPNSFLSRLMYALFHQSLIKRLSFLFLNERQTHFWFVPNSIHDESTLNRSTLPTYTYIISKLTARRMNKWRVLPSQPSCRHRPYHIDKRAGLFITAFTFLISFTSLLDNHLNLNFNRQNIF